MKLRLHIGTAFVAGLLSGGTLLVGQSTDTVKAEVMKEIQICDLFRRLDSFAGKRVAVRGVYRFSMELAGLYSEGCRKPLILDGVERAQALDCEFVSTTQQQLSEYAHFTEITDKVAKGGGREAIHVTFIGTLVTRNPDLHQAGHRQGERMFGHLGAYPARLEVSDIKNIEIEHNALKPSNMELRR